MEEDIGNDDIELIIPYFTEEQRWIIQQRLDKVNYH